MKRNRYLLSCLTGISLLVSCSEGTWLMYDTNQKDRIYFTAPGDHIVESFALLSEDNMEFELKLHIMGTPKDFDRTCEFDLMDAGFDEVIVVGNDTLDVFTAVEGQDFELGGITIPAGSVEGTLPLTIHRSPKMNGKYFKIDIRIRQGDEFLPMDPDSTNLKSIITPEYILFVTDGEPACPAWWKTESHGVDYQWGAYYGKFTPHKFRKMLEFYHQIETRNPPLFSDLVEKYGYNIDKEGLARNFMSFQDQSVWATYVLIPLHDYYVEYYAEHPEEAETFGLTGDLTTFTWGDPLRLLR